MAEVLVTEMSGTGRSSALRLLRARAYRTVETDTDEWSYWVDRLVARIAERTDDPFGKTAAERVMIHNFVEEVELG